MHSHDVFRRSLQRVASEIDPWLRQQGDVADVQHDWTGDLWRLELRPHAPAACALEILLHAADSADVAVAGETYEGIDLGGADAVAPLIRAIFEGRVTHLSSVSAATGRVISTRVLVDFGSGRHLDLGRPAETGGATIQRLRHFAPYRR